MIVKIKQGLLSGKEDVSILTGEKYCSFLGIPFAQPPVGSLRFQAPKEHNGWSGIFEAIKDKDKCIQFDPYSRVIEGSEDCLFLNVYTPQIPGTTSDKKAVLVFIPGGGFVNGSAQNYKYKPDYFMKYDVIVVVVNYRLHILGFFDLGLPNCPGNVGLKDQTFALKWIRNNIGAFGGDENNVTIFGVSAGATCAQFHTISPLSQGLFDKAILQSGGCTNTFALQDKTEETISKFKRCLGYEGSSKAEDFLEFLLKVDAKRFVEICQDEKLDGFTANSFSPVVEKIKENAFIPYSREELFKRAKPIPIIAGVNDNECIIVLRSISLEEIIRDVVEQIPRLIKNHIPELVKDETRIPSIVEKIKNFYFGNEVSNKNILTKAINMNTDVIFIRPLYNPIQEPFISKGPFYVYCFTFDGDYSFRKRRFFSKVTDPALHVKGASHADDLGYLFYSTLYDKPIFKEPETIVIDNICRLWTNFAKTGKPTENMDVVWSPFTFDDPSYLEIDVILKSKPGLIADESLKFWQQLIESETSKKD